MSRGGGMGRAGSFDPFKIYNIPQQTPGENRTSQQTPSLLLQNFTQVSLNSESERIFVNDVERLGQSSASSATVVAGHGDTQPTSPSTSSFPSPSTAVRSRLVVSPPGGSLRPIPKSHRSLHGLTAPVGSSDEVNTLTGHICLMEPPPLQNKTTQQIPQKLWVAAYSILWWYGREEGDWVHSESFIRLHSAIFKEAPDITAGAGFKNIRMFLQHLQEWVSTEWDAVGGLWIHLRFHPLPQAQMKPSHLFDVSKSKDVLMQMKYPMLEDDIDDFEEFLHDFKPHFPPPSSRCKALALDVRMKVYFLLLCHFPKRMDYQQLNHAFQKKYKIGLDTLVGKTEPKKLFLEYLCDIIDFTEISPVHGTVRARLDIAIRETQDLREILDKTGLMESFREAQKNCVREAGNTQDTGVEEGASCSYNMTITHGFRPQTVEVPVGSRNHAKSPSPPTNSFQNNRRSPNRDNRPPARRGRQVRSPNPPRTSPSPQQSFTSSPPRTEQFQPTLPRSPPPTTFPQELQSQSRGSPRRSMGGGSEEKLKEIILGHILRDERQGIPLAQLSTIVKNGIRDGYYSFPNVDFGAMTSKDIVDLVEGEVHVNTDSKGNRWLRLKEFEDYAWKPTAFGQQSSSASNQEPNPPVQRRYSESQLLGLRTSSPPASRSLVPNKEAARRIVASNARTNGRRNDQIQEGAARNLEDLDRRNKAKDVYDALLTMTSTVMEEIAVQDIKTAYRVAKLRDGITDHYIDDATQALVLDMIGMSRDLEIFHNDNFGDNAVRKKRSPRREAETQETETTRTFSRKY